MYNLRVFGFILSHNPACTILCRGTTLFMEDNPIIMTMVKILLTIENMFRKLKIVKPIPFKTKILKPSVLKVSTFVRKLTLGILCFRHVIEKRF